MKQNTKKIVYAGAVWSFIFALMSFYWAAGGMIGVKSLGGVIYQKAIERDPSFITVVWVTGVIKLAGAVVLLLLLNMRPNTRVKKLLSQFCITAGILMMLYGVGNFITISLAGLNVLNFDLSAYAMTWRLIFWEPFWVAGGILYFLAGKRVD